MAWLATAVAKATPWAISEQMSNSTARNTDPLVYLTRALGRHVAWLATAVAPLWLWAVFDLMSAFTAPIACRFYLVAFLREMASSAAFKTEAHMFDGMRSSLSGPQVVRL